MRHRAWISLVLSFAVLLVLGGVAAAAGPHPDSIDVVPSPVPNYFTFQGQIQQSGVHVTGTCDLQFTLYNAGIGGADIGGGPQTYLGQVVSNGLFTINLPWGDSFTGDDRWVETAVRCPAGGGSYTTLAPRQHITAAPYAFGLRLPFTGAFSSSNALFFLTNGGTGGAASLSVANPAANQPALNVTTDSTGSSAIYGEVTTTSAGDGQSAISGVNKSTTALGIGVSGTQNGGGWGVYGYTPSGIGVYGTTVSGTGVYGGASSGTGVIGSSNAAVGVFGQSANGKGVYGTHSATTGVEPGVLGDTSSTDGGAVGVQGYVTSTSPGPNSAAVKGINSGTGFFGIGVQGSQGGSGWGVYGQTPSGRGVYGSSTSGVGVYGDSTSSSGVYGFSSSANGVYGESSTGSGVYGIHDATSGTTAAILGESSSQDGGAIGVEGHITSTTPGGNSAAVKGINDGTGFLGIGVWGAQNGSGYGVEGSSPAGRGVYGSSTSGTGVYGSSTSGTGVYGSSSTGKAGYFFGDVQVTGTLAKGGGSFKIDDPIDPANKYLYHSFVESPDMKNVYDGVVTTDAQGFATVTLPDWFQALNRDFRYQLTVVGKEWAQARIEEEIADNKFVIRTDKPNVKVSWQVTGIRQDAFANAHRIPVEEEKPAAERGKYLYPKEQGQPASLGIDRPEPTAAQP